MSEFEFAPSYIDIATCEGVVCPLYDMKAADKSKRPSSVTLPWSDAFRMSKTTLRTAVSVLCTVVAYRQTAGLAVDDYGQERLSVGGRPVFR